MMDLSTIKKMQDEMTALINKEGQKILGREFKKFFKKHPEVEAVRWEQYTPYFNDGDECVFRVCDFTYAFSEGVSSEADYADFEDEDDTPFYGTWTIREQKADFVESAREFERLTSNREVMRDFRRGRVRA